jgi:hypothetical protein
MTAEKAFGAFDDPAGYCGKAISPGHLREMLLSHKPLMVQLSHHTARDLYCLCVSSWQEDGRVNKAQTALSTN